MNKKYIYLLPWFALLLTGVAYAGNPDRQGEAGANQLLVNPWARSAGLHTSTTSMITGAEAMFLNVAGLSRINKMQVQIGHTRYLDGIDVSVNALGFANKVGKNGAFGVSLVAFDMGDIDLTSEDLPQGSNATYSPSFFNMGISYSHLFANKVSVGVTAKFVNESVTNVSARAIALDAGVQYVSGANDNFKFGISLRNVGSRMRFTGEGLSKPRPAPNSSYEFVNNYYERTATYELPSQLNIGSSYDWLIGRNNRLTLVANFTSNAFSRDQLAGGLQFALGQSFALRAGYKYEFNQVSGEESLDNGISAGFSASVPMKKNSSTRLTFDYGYRSTEIFNGIHNLGVRIDL